MRAHRKPAGAAQIKLAAPVDTIDTFRDFGPIHWQLTLSAHPIRDGYRDAMDQQTLTSADRATPETDARAVVTDAIQTVGIGMVLYDENLGFVFGNQHWKETFFADRAVDPGESAVEQLHHLVSDGTFIVPEGVSDDEFSNQIIALLRSYATDVNIALSRGRTLNASVHRTGLGGYLISFRDIGPELHAKAEAEQQRVKTERANTRLRDALESIGEGFALFDRDDRLILANDLYKSANPAAAHLMTFGRPRKDIIEAMTHGGDIVGVEDWVDSYDRETKAGDTASPRRYEVHHADGRIFLASRGRTAEGGCTITWLDITDSKKTEERARALAHDAMEALDEGFALFDANMRFEFCNQKYKDLVFDDDFDFAIGTPVGEIAAKSFDSGLYDTGGLTRDEYAQAMTEATRTFQKKLEFTRIDGRTFEASSHETKLGGYLITVLDVTDRRKTEERARALAHDAMEALDEGFALFDADMRFEFCNRIYKDVVLGGIMDFTPGMSVEEVVGAAFDSGIYEIPGLSREEYIAAMKEFARTYQKNAEFVRKDGRIFEASAHQTGLGGYLITARDVTEQRAIEAERRRAAERELEVVTDTMQSLITAIALFDADLNFVMGNPGYFDMWYHKAGIAPAEPGENLASILDRLLDVEYFVLPEGVDRAMAHDLMMQSVQTFSKNVPLEARTGSYVGHVSPAGNGGYLVEFTDLTEQKALEEERRRAETRELAAVSDAMQELVTEVALYDADLNFVMGNRGYFEMWHDAPRIPRAERGENLRSILGRLLDADFLVTPDDLERDEAIEMLLTATKTYSKSVPLETRSGSYVGHSSPTGDGGYLIEFTDLTEQKALEEERRLTEARKLDAVNDAVQALATHIALYDSDMNFVLGNQSFFDTWSDPEKMDPVKPGQSLRSVADRLASSGLVSLPEGLDREAFVDHMLEATTNYEKNVELASPKGSFLVNTHRTALGGYLFETWDVTRQRAAEVELKRQREVAHQNEKLSAMGELLAGVAHELNNPLSIVVGYAMMMQNAVKDPKLKRQADNIAQAAERCSRIVKAFLAMARQRPAELKRCSLNELLMAALDMVGHRLRGAGIEVTVELDPDLPDVDADEDQIIQVLTNLIVNAEQALDEQETPRTLHLRSFHDAAEGRSVVRVSDNGPGVSPDLQSRIFEPFFTTKDVGTGTGIGLAFCHRVIDSHDGRMTVRSHPGKGARFYVRLNCAAGPEVRTIVEDPAIETVSGDVLVVDDEAGVAALIGDVLTEAGYRVEIRNTAAEALELVRKQSFDAVLSDMKMPGMDGPAFYAALSEIDPAIAARTAFVTGDTLSRDVAVFLSETSQPYLEKPVTPIELLNLVSGLIERRRS